MSIQILPDEFGGSISGRLGKGIGKGLSEQLPKEVERLRLSSGLRNLEKESGNLDPLQYFTKAVTLPGITPQMVESLGQLARQRLKNRSFDNYGGKPSPQDQIAAITQNLSSKSNQSDIPSITKSAGTQAAQQTFIPRDLETEIIPAAVEAFSRNPGRFHNDIQEAIDFEVSKDANQQQINQAFREQRTSQQNVQDRALKDFREYLSRRNINTAGGVEIPRNELEPLERQLMQSILPVNEGGEGLVEEQAARKYEKIADQIARDYSALRSKGGKGKYFRSPSDVIKELQPLRKKFEERGMLENFADELMPTLNVSARRAYGIAYPIAKDAPVSKELNRIPTFVERVREAGPGARLTPFKETEKISPTFADLIGENSPLAIADALNSKGYDPDTFLNYVIDHQDELNFSERQIRELQKSRGNFSLGNIYYDSMKRK